MLPHPGGWEKPIHEVIYLLHHKTSTPNNLEKPHKVCFIRILNVLGKNEKKNITTQSVAYQRTPHL